MGLHVSSNDASGIEDPGVVGAGEAARGVKEYCRSLFTVVYGTLGVLAR